MKRPSGVMPSPSQLGVRAAAVLAAVAVGMASCQSSSHIPQAAADDQRFQATRVEIHPLSHIQMRPDGTAIVEIAVRVLDEDGLPVRSTGRLEVDLHQRGRHGEATMTRQTWERDLNQAAANRRAFDATTRTYRAPLQLAADEVPRAPTVTVRLVTAGRGTLEAARSLDVIDASPRETAPPGTPPESPPQAPPGADPRRPAD